MRRNHLSLLPLCVLIVGGCGEVGVVGGGTTLVTDMVDVPQEVAAASMGTGGLRTFASGTPTVLYLNFEGANIIHGMKSDAATNTSFIGGGTVPPFSGDKQQVIDLVKQLYASFNIQIVTDRPASGDYDMVMIGGTPADLGLNYPSTVAGVAPMDCGDLMPRDIAFVFADSIKALVPSSALAVQVAETSAHESAHTYGLPHSADPCDLMSYGNCSKLKTFLDKMMSMQSDSYGKCGLTQMNSHQMLLDNLGPAGSTQPPPPPPADDTTPPAVGITSPAAGATVTSGTTVKAVITDNKGVVKAELLVDGKLVTSRTTAPWELNAGTLSQGTHVFKVKAYDAAGNAGEASVTVSVPGTQPPPPPNQDTAPPSVAITSPASGATVATNITVKTSVSDDKGVVKAELLVDGSIVSSRTAAPWEFNVALNMGTHKLEVNAYDAAGNKGSAMVTVTVTDATPPTTSPPDPGTSPTDPSPPPPPPEGSFGSNCESAEDCDSQLCARDETFAVTYCTEPCDPGSNACPDGAGCFPAGGEVHVCGPPEQAPENFAADGDSLIGGCTLGGSGAGNPAGLLALLLALVIGRCRLRRR